MGKRNFDNLVNNVIGTPKQKDAPSEANVHTLSEVIPEEPGKAAVKRGRPAKDTEATENFCGRADSSKLAKIRAVAEKENIPIKDLYNLAFDLFINAYEEKHGTISVKYKQIKGDASSLI